jgi:endonuclease/exonuclease/phosphatase family metal-dependent hydrolase
MKTFKVATYNIHKGVQGLGPARRLEIHNLGHAVEQFDADVVCLQEVSSFNRQQARRFKYWPELGQADYLAPEGYTPIYRTNAVTKHGEHGNALLSRWPVLEHRHEDMSDHRLEQRGLLHGVIKVNGREVHCFVVHLGLFAGGRVRQIEVMAERIRRMVPDDAPMLIAGDFNDWKDRLAPFFVEQLGVYEVFANSPRTQGMLPRFRESMHQLRGVWRGESADEIRAGMFRRQHLRMNQLSTQGAQSPLPPPRTFPSAFPWLRLDRIYQRGFAVRSAKVLRGRPWSVLSDHAPIFAELELP